MKTPFLFIAAILIANVAAAAPTEVKCTRKSGEEMPVNNEQVLQWKKAATNEFVRARAHVKGTVTKLIPDRLHQRFEIQIGPEKDDTVAIFYNGSFPPKPKVKKGDPIEACGEFVANSYTRLPDPKPEQNSAIVFWTHKFGFYPHPEGFLTASGKTYGLSKMPVSHASEQKTNE
jgi:hypothetical protein